MAVQDDVRGLYAIRYILFVCQEYCLRNVFYISDVRAHVHFPAQLQYRFFSHAIDEQVCIAIAEYAFAQFVLPVVIMC